MNIILTFFESIYPVIYLAGFFIFIRSVGMATGKVKRKYFRKETFLFWQKVLAVLWLITLAFQIVGSIYLQLSIMPRIDFWIQIINLILLMIFYLQPTPRISRKVLYAFLTVNILFIVLILSSIFFMHYIDFKK